MSISEHLEAFFGLPIREFQAEDGVIDAVDAAWRLSLDYDAVTSGRTFQGLLDRFLADPGSRQVTAIVIGSWENAEDSETSSEALVEALVAARGQLPALKALFLGDITYEETEISWINQSNITSLLNTYEDLEEFGIRGSTELAIFATGHRSLKRLVIESGGLPGTIVQAVGRMDLPELEDLELWLGTETYGGDTSDEDLAEILSGKNLPKLHRLALRDSDQADRVAALVAESDILKRIEELDLSMGTLGDEGALALIASPALSHLKKLNISHHYVSDEVLDGLIAKGIEVDASDRQDPDENDGDRYVAVSE